MSIDVFISYSREDERFAGEMCKLLEERGLTCWIAPRNLAAGAEWDEAILDAIDMSQTFLLILSKNANASRFVRSEVNRAFSVGKTIFVFRVEDVRPAKGLELYLSRHHWTDGFPPPVTEKIDGIAAAIGALLGKTLHLRTSEREAEYGEFFDEDGNFCSPCPT